MKPWACPGGCGLCCGVTRLAGSGSVHGLVAADVERSRGPYNPCRWSWEQLRQLIITPMEAGFHVVHVPIRDTGEIPAANGSFDIAVLGIVPSVIPMLDAVTPSLIRCVHPGGLVVAVQPLLAACRTEYTQTSEMKGSNIARCVELLREQGCRSISLLNDSGPRCCMKHSRDGFGISCRCAGSHESAYPVAVVAQVGISERKRTL